jgi:hypothetical protein
MAAYLPPLKLLYDLTMVTGPSFGNEQKLREIVD